MYIRHSNLNEVPFINDTTRYQHPTQQQYFLDEASELTFYNVNNSSLKGFLRCPRLTIHLVGTIFMISFNTSLQNQTE